MLGQFNEEGFPPFTTQPDHIFGNVYEGISPLGNAPFVQAWSLAVPPLDEEDAFARFSVQFIIPTDADLTMPVFLDIHLLIAQNGITAPNNNALLRVFCDYRDNLGTFGTGAGGNSFSETIGTGDFAIIEPVGASTNLLHQVVTLPLDNTLMTNNGWGYFSISRLFPNGIGYDATFYLTEVAFRYTRICETLT